MQILACPNMEIWRLTEQTTSLVEVGIVGPAVERSKSLLSHTSSSTTVNGAVGTGVVPC